MAEENQYNIRIEKGADFVLPFTWKDENGNPYNLTNAIVEAQIREFPEAIDCYEFYCIHNNSGGRITLTMLHDTTVQIPFKTGYYDVHVTFPDGIRKRPLYGEVEIKPNITKPIDGNPIYMTAIETYDALPDVGKENRIYFIYDTMEYYRWNGKNYILTGMANVKSIEKISSEKLIDTYRMTFENGRYFDYQITNGRGIESIEKIGESGDYAEGIVDIYRIYYNDETTHDYEIRNGRIVFALFDLSAETGHLTMTSPSWYEGPDFVLDEDSGHLSIIME